MNILEKYNQEQLERFYKDLNKTEQNKLQKEIENIDFIRDRFGGLFFICSNEPPAVLVG